MYFSHYYDHTLLKILQYMAYFAFWIFFYPNLKHEKKIVIYLHPKDVDTALGLRLRPAKSFVKASHSEIRGRSSATTTQVRTQARLTPLAFNWGTEPPRPKVNVNIIISFLYSKFQQNTKTIVNQNKKSWKLKKFK